MDDVGLVGTEGGDGAGVRRGLANDDVAVDLAAVTFMDSSGISVLIGAHRQSADLGHRLTLRFPSPAVVKVLKITGVDEVLTIEAAD